MFYVNVVTLASKVNYLPEGKEKAGEEEKTDMNQNEQLDFQELFLKP